MIGVQFSVFGPDVNRVVCGGEDVKYLFEEIGGTAL